MNKGTADVKSFPEYLKAGKRAMQNISESIILQSIEDLWDESEHVRRSSFAFFLGEGFHICSELAGITVADRRKLLSLIVEAVKYKKVPVAIPEVQSVDREYALSGI